MGLDFASLKAFDHSGGIIFMLLVCILLLLWSRLKHPKHGFVVAFITGIFFTRCVFVLLNCFYDFMPLTQDAVRFNETMIDLANVLENNGIIAIKNKILNTYVLIPSFTLPYAVFYYLFGHTPMISFTLNTLLFAYLTFNVYRVGAMLYTKQAGVFAAIIYSLLPYSSIHSTYLYRDPLVNCILMEIFYQILIFFDNIKKRWIWIGFLFLLTALLRSENLVIFTAIFAIIMLKYNFEKITLLMPIRAIGVLFVLTMVTVYIFQNLDKSFVSIFAQLVDVEVLKERLHMNIIESSYLQDQTFNSYGDIFRYMPIRTIYFMFSPFPWDWFKIIQAIPFAEAMIILVFLLALPKAMKQQYKKRKIFILSVLIYLTIGILGSSLIQNNSAAAQRHRTQFNFLIIAIAAPFLYETFFKRIRLLRNNQRFDSMKMLTEIKKVKEHPILLGTLKNKFSFKIFDWLESNPKKNKFDDSG